MVKYIKAPIRYKLINVDQILKPGKDGLEFSAVYLKPCFLLAFGHVKSIHLIANKCKVFTPVHR